ncbi:hypothetical protein LNTAR_23039 [Lentisphaera araneosa HTCC2155]|uniref:DUF1592 domain-containing protein n=1 Tax=Lentisphaera araneosa HTCC2155 TaxID=313628 RepID=A6DGJ9_9BACT|nr:DUF1592 domain-containing protein [Lentisphaera araneosa]EDM29316.1 hypothetical protein LNTAR_23039 [Lentisphaera araneosa HTCC2155]
MIKFYCEHCTQKLSATEEIYGTEIQCPSCSHNILVPPGPETPPSQDIELDLLNEDSNSLESESTDEALTLDSEELEVLPPLKAKKKKSFSAGKKTKCSQSSNRIKSRTPRAVAPKKKKILPMIFGLLIIGLIAGSLIFKNKISSNLTKTELSSSALKAGSEVLQFSEKELLAQKEMIMQIKPFMEKYCLDCHNEEKQKGEIRLDNIDFNMVQHDSVYMWSDILDVLNVGEMPPKKADQPHTKELSNAISLITGQVLLARKRLSSTGGMIAMRHLNKREYYGSIEDLIGLKLPDNYLDNELSPNFDTNGADQFFSSRTYNTYMKVGTEIMTQALKSYSIDSKNPKKSKFAPAGRAYARQKKALDKLEKTMALINSGASMEKIGLGDAGQVKLFKMRYEKAIAAPKKYLDIELHKTGVTSEFTPRFGRNVALKPGARYIYRIHGSSKSAVDIKVYAQDKMIGTLNFKASTKVQNYEFSFTTDTLELRQRIGFSMEKIKGIYIESEELEGPFEAQSSFSENLFKPLLKKKELNDFELSQVFKKFAQRAFRHQEVDDNYIKALVDIYKSKKTSGKNFIDSFSTPLAMILSSPSFLYIKETNEGQRAPLDQEQFAIRLAYFLWSSPPDEALYKVAKANKLYDQEILETQFERMIKSPKASQFIEGFINQWIGMERYDEVDLPNKLLGTFQQSARQELSEYFKVLVQENLPVDKLIDSDFVVLNQTLADYYKIEGEFSGFQKVALPANNPRGGLLGQAAFHIMGSAASRTSPSIRGTLIRESLLHDPPPPPPANVPEIDNTRQGQFSVRDLVKHHQELPQCSSCHAKIDPIGLGLENFDYLGRWRDSETIGADTKRVKGKKRSRGKKLAIDASGYISEGEEFQDFAGFKNALLKNKGKLAESLYSSMLAYGIGREIEFIDEEEIHQNLLILEKDNYPIKNMIYQLIASETFRTK